MEIGFHCSAGDSGDVCFAFIGGELVLHLWNWLLPSLFGFRPITFWQALGPPGAVPHPLQRIWACSHRSSFRRRMGERFDHMTPEERERFRQRMRERFGCGPVATNTSL